MRHSTHRSTTPKTKRPRWRLPRLALGLLLLLSLLGVDLGAASAVEQAPFSGRWIDVNLTSLTATAYEGSKAVYTAPVTAGKRGFATPTGTFSIYHRTRTQDMRSSPGDRERYLVEDVEYVQYFRSGGYAIHSNYWQPDWVFGRAFTSHGCISMRKRHAAYFWSFASIGTPVRIYYGPQPKVSVPSVSGKTRSAATSQLQSAGFKVAVASRATTRSVAGTVVSQKPAAGTSAKKGSTVTLFVAVEPTPAAARPPAARDPDDGAARAPAVVGLPESAAVERIERAGLRATYINYADEKDMPASRRAAFRAAKPGTVVAALTGPDVHLPRGGDYMIVVKRK